MAEVMAIFIALAEVGPQKMLEIKADSRAAIGALSALHHRDPTTVMLMKKKKIRASDVADGVPRWPRTKLGEAGLRKTATAVYQKTTGLQALLQRFSASINQMQDPAMDQIAQVLKNLIESQNARDIRQEERDRRQERDTKHEAEFSELRQTNQEILTSLKNLNTVPAAPRQGNFRRLQPVYETPTKRGTGFTRSGSEYVEQLIGQITGQSTEQSTEQSTGQSIDSTPHSLRNQIGGTAAERYKTIGRHIAPYTFKSADIYQILDHYRIALPQLGSLNDTKSEISKIQSKFRDLYSKSTILEGDYYKNSQLKPMTTERHVQNAMYLLLLSVYETIATRNDKPRLRCCDTSASPLDDANKPDFVFVPADTDNADWESACVAIELKAINRPRKYCVGLVSYKDELHILLNTRDAINHAVVGKLPFVDSVRKCIYRSRENAHITFKEGNGELVVRALAMIFGMSLEQCGFLVPQLGGVYHQFGLLVEKPSIDQAEAVLSAVAGSTPTANCLINLSIGGYLSGRVMFPVGTTSWVHKASVDVRTGNNSFQGSAVVKIQWRRSSRRTESSVYRVLHDMKIPNVPQVIFSGCIGMGTLRIESRCDVLVLEPCGVGIIQYVQKLAAGHETNHWMLLDVACGYIHTLYAAWSGTTYKILHRDISSGNLMVANNSARVIDWEYGLLFNINRRPGVNADSLTGTMVYASMAVLRGVTLRTPFDDIESLFYVLMHAIEKAYNNHGKGRGTAQNKTAQRLWDGNLSVEELINERITVFGSGIEYKKRLGAKCPSSWIVLVESMYNALAIGTQATLSDVTFDIDFDECMQRLVQDLQPLLQEREMDSNHYTALLRFCNTVGKRTSAA
ncbi:hypothetical protein LPJ74_004356 [Coemansia sp. RSA 1843]|nr:hypothetical protein LPJ74_004356 [Coemansia sp. RSA 1843]